MNPFKVGDEIKRCCGPSLPGYLPDVGHNFIVISKNVKYVLIMSPILKREQWWHYSHFSLVKKGIQ